MPVCTVHIYVWRGACPSIQAIEPSFLFSIHISGIHSVPLRSWDLRDDLLNMSRQGGEMCRHGLACFRPDALVLYITELGETNRGGGRSVQVAGKDQTRRLSTSLRIKRNSGSPT